MRNSATRLSIEQQSNFINTTAHQKNKYTESIIQIQQNYQSEYQSVKPHERRTHYHYPQNIKLNLLQKLQDMTTHHKQHEKIGTIRPRIRIQSNSQYKINTTQKKEQKSKYELRQKYHFKLIISNQHSKREMMHGKQFKDLLDARDNLLIHDFHFEVNEQQNLQELDFLKTITYKQIIRCIKSFMVQTLANILSISFRYFHEHKLQENQVKNYAASNIMLNFHQIFSKTIQALEEKKKDFKWIKMQEVKFDLVFKIQKIIKQILINLADYYPEAPASRGAARIKEAIQQIYKIQDEENDLIYNNGIKISKYINSKGSQKQSKSQQKQDEDYTQFIMQVINTAIEVVQTKQEQSQEKSNQQIFTEFCRQLFALSENQSFKKLVDMAELKVEKKANEAIIFYFNRITQLNQSKLSSIKNTILNYKINKEEQNPSCSTLCALINQERQKNLQALKNYAVGLKLPNEVKPFSKQEIDDKNFTVKHSSVLRTMTKWADYLTQIFDQPQKNIKTRITKFKDTQNNKIDLDKDERQKLVNKIIAQRKIVAQKLSAIKMRVIEIIGLIASHQNDSFLQSVYRFSTTRKISSKINAVLTTLMVKYLSVLIHSLLKVGRKQKQQKNGNINLLVFRVSDLMRAKFKCSEASLITLLKTMYILDDKQEMKNQFRLIRIKNKLQGSAGNIMVNFIFKGKINCELQLSTQQSKGKEKFYYTFSHFVYELTRGNFGIISQCAIMISQLDPMINSCKYSYYREKKQKPVKKPKQFKLEEDKSKKIFYCQNIRKQIQDNQNKQNLYQQEVDKGDQEKVCQKIVISQNADLFHKYKGKYCLECIYNKMKNQNEFLQTFKDKHEHKMTLSNHLQNKVLVRIKNYQQLKVQNWSCYQKVLSSGKYEYIVVINSKSEQKHFIVKLTPLIIKRVKNLIIQNQSYRLPDNNQHAEIMNFADCVRYLNIQKHIKEQVQINDQFLFQIKKDQIEQHQALKKMIGDPNIRNSKIDNGKSNTISDFLNKLYADFICFRKQKDIIKTIKLRKQIINCDNDKQKWKNFQLIVGVYLKDKGQKRMAQLRYQKYKQLYFGNLKTIQATNLQLQKLFDIQPQKLITLKQLVLKNNKLKKVKEVVKLVSLKVLDLSHNQIQDIESFLGITQMISINLSHNNLTKIDGLKRLEKIDQLDLSYNKIKDVYGLKRVEQIKHLKLDYNQLLNIDSMRGITKIDTLSITYNLLKEVLSLRSITNVNKLDLSHNKLQDLSGLQGIIQINELNISHNQLQYNYGLIGIKKIKKLNLSNNKLQDINGLGNIISIQQLDLSNNKLANLAGLKGYNHNGATKNNNNAQESSTEVNNLQNNQKQFVQSKIKKLDISHNQLTTLNGLESINLIGILDASHNKLQNINGMENMIQVNTLNLSHNKLKKLQKIQKLKDLQHLDLSYNQFLQSIETINLMHRPMQSKHKMK